mgnify:FL=1
MSQIITVPAPILRAPAKPVETLDKRVPDIINNMTKVLKEAKRPQGVGLAAPQIGVSLRIFLIRPAAAGPITTFINPEIIKYSQRQTHPTSKHGIYEGCLSIPGHYAPVKRSISVVVKFETIENNKLKIMQQSFSGFSAHVIQHEMDHLNGILFIDRCLEQNAKLYKTEGKDWIEVGI